MFKGAQGGTNMVFVLPEEFRPPSKQQMAEFMAQLSLGLAAIVFEKPGDKKYRHLRPLHVRGFINGKPVGRMLVDTRATVNVMPYSMCRRLGRAAEDLSETNVTLNDFKGNSSQVKGVLNAELTLSSKTLNTSFFVVDN